MMNPSALAEEFEAIIGWPYASPGVTDERGKTLGIDCSGAFVRAYRKHGKTIAHGSNTIFRKHCSETGATQGDMNHLEVGMAVFKRRDDGGEPARYQGDGHGNLYHIGLVTGVKPLRIVHATPPAAKADGNLGEWRYYGRLADVAYGMEGEQEMRTWRAAVTSADGNPVKLRKDPSTKNPYLDKIAVGSVVTVEEQALTQEGTEWARVAYDGKRGYMMARYLDALEDDENPSEGHESAPEEEIELLIGMERSLAEALRLIGELSERVTELEEKQP